MIASERTADQGVDQPVICSVFDDVFIKRGAGSCQQLHHRVLRNLFSCPNYNPEFHMSQGHTVGMDARLSCEDKST